MLWLFRLVGVLVALAVFAGGLVSFLFIMDGWLVGCFGCFGFLVGWLLWLFWLVGCLVALALLDGEFVD